MDLDLTLTVIANGCYRWLARQLKGFGTAKPKQLYRRELLRKIAAQSVGRPVTVVLDNARYQYCQVVLDLAQELGIELLYLPSYSPNLNLIERLWKFVQTPELFTHSVAGTFKGDQR